MARKAAAKQLIAYFDDKGPMNLKQYLAAEDPPVRIQALRRLFSSWNMIEKVLNNYRKKTKPTEKPSGKKAI